MKSCSQEKSFETYFESDLFRGEQLVKMGWGIK